MELSIENAMIILANLGIFVGVLSIILSPFIIQFLNRNKEPVRETTP